MNKLFLFTIALFIGTQSYGQCVNNYPYFQNFEASAGGFAASGVTSFAHGTPAGSTINAAASGTKAWKTNLTGVYNNNETGYVQSPCFDLTTFAPNQVPMLSMKIWYNCENNWDNANVKYSTNGGTTWQILGNVNGRWYDKVGNTMFGPMMEDSWNGSTGGWRYVRQTLLPLANQNNVIFRIYFSSDPIYPSGDGFAFDDFSIFDFSPVVDATLNGASQNRASGCGLSGTSIISANIANVGGAPISNFNVSYKVNGGATITEQVTATINPNANYTHVFATPYTITTPNTYNIQVATTIANDVDTMNNKANTFFVSAPYINAYPYLQNFENGAGGFFRGGSPNTFALGNAVQGSTFYPAASGTKIWTTAPTFPYANEEDSYVQSPCFDLTTFAPGAVPTLGIKIWYDSETGYDNSNVKYSTDGGVTFNVLGTVGPNWYNFSGASVSGRMKQDSWSGANVQSSQNWISARQNISFLSNQSNVIFRVCFNADAYNNIGDGVALDDFTIYDNSAFVDAKITQSSFASLSNCGLSGTVVPITISINNIGATTLSNIPVAYSINGGAMVNEIFNTNIPPNTTQSYTFNTQVNVNNLGVYRAQTFVNMPNDGDATNNASEAYINNSFLVNNFPYNEDFEASNGNFYVASDSTTFEWGAPNSQALTTAGSGTKAWKTRLTANYQNSERGFVQSPCYNMSSLQNPKISLKVWYTTETNWDNANIKYSTDGGITFNVLGGVNAAWYNAPQALIAGPMKENSWSGAGFNSSMGWRTVQGYYPNLGGKSSVIFRIYFASDGSTVSGGGFAFDDFNITDAPTQLAPFVLRTPTPATFINIEGGVTTAINLKWQKTTGNTPQPITYTWLTDALGGNFANPTLAVAANNFGADSTITFTYGRLDSIMSARNINIGDTLKFIWTVRATNGVISRFADAPFALYLRRGIVNVSTQNVVFDNNIKIYPTPANHQITLDFDNSINVSNIKITINNALGNATAAPIVVQNQRIDIDTKKMASGIYFIQITDDKYTTTKKMVVNH